MEQFIESQSNEQFLKSSEFFDLSTINSVIFAQKLYGLAKRIEKLPASYSHLSIDDFVKSGEREHRMDFGFSGFTPEEGDNFSEVLGFRVPLNNNSNIEKLDTIPLKELAHIVTTWAFEIDPEVEERLADDE